MWYNSVGDVPEDIYLATILNEVDEEDDDDEDDEEDLIEPDDDDEDFWDDTDIEE